jgi:hypothetical protein
MQYQVLIWPQIGWIEVTTENGASGYYWYMKFGSTKLV